jgi:hypothetical protein
MIVANNGDLDRQRARQGGGPKDFQSLAQYAYGSGMAKDGHESSQQTANELLKGGEGFSKLGGGEADD